MPPLWYSTEPIDGTSSFKSEMKNNYSKQNHGRGILNTPANGMLSEPISPPPQHRSQTDSTSAAFTQG